MGCWTTFYGTTGIPKVPVMPPRIVLSSDASIMSSLPSPEYMAEKFALFLHKNQHNDDSGTKGQENSMVGSFFDEDYIKKSGIFG